MAARITVYIIAEAVTITVLEGNKDNPLCWYILRGVTAIII